MKTRRPAALVTAAALFVLTASAPGDTPAGPPVGALTLEPSSYARFSGLFRAPVNPRVRRDAMGRPLPAWSQDAYDRELSDSFTVHDHARAQVAPGQQTIPAQPNSAPNVQETPRPAPVPVPAASVLDVLPPIVAPVAAHAATVDLLSGQPQIGQQLDD